VKQITDKMVNYRKQIACQHSCYKIFGRDRGRDGPYKTVLSSSFIIMQNSVAVCHTVWAYYSVCRSPFGRGAGRWGLALWDVRAADPRNTPLPSMSPCQVWSL